jgi:ABC-type multidrug transport system fused ATPase/permease subunit
LAIDPKVLLLDDFTARVDGSTEKKILANVQKNYPGLTLISVTQKIASVEHYDQIILLMQGEIVATGTHDELMHSSPEYVQIFDSQQSTSNYEYNLNDLQANAPKSSTWSSLGKLLQLIRHERKNLLMALAAILVNSFLNLMGPLIIGHTIDKYILFAIKIIMAYW